MANYLTVRLTDDPSAVRFFQKLTLSLSFRAETERFSKIVGTFILSISNNSASVAAHIRRLIIDTALSVLQVWRSSSYLPVAMEPGPCIGFCRYGVSSSYLPPTRKWVRLRCFASMAFRAVTCPFEEADSCMSSFAGISSRAATYPPVFVICLNPDFESMAFRAVTYLTEASMLGLPILQVWRFE